jgi:hypothetical protein
MQAEQREAHAAWEGHVKEWDGQMTGAGAIVPDGSFHFLGVCTTPEGFTVDENQTNLTITMTWEHAVPQPFFLDVFNEQGRHLIESTPPYNGTAGLTYHAQNPLPGQWSAIGLVNGTAVDANYHIQVILA